MRKVLILTTAVLAVVTTAGAANASTPRHDAAYKAVTSVRVTAPDQLQVTYRCTGGDLPVYLSVDLDRSDPDYVPDDPDDLVPPIGAMSYEGGNAGIYAYLADCTGKRVTSTLEVFPYRVGYDLPDEGPCIGYCHYNFSRPLERGDRVTASVTFDDSGETVTSPVLRVR